MSGFNAILVDAPQPFAAVVRPFRVTRARRFLVVLEPTLLGVAEAQTSLITEYPTLRRPVRSHRILHR